MENQEKQINVYNDKISNGSFYKLYYSDAQNPYLTFKELGMLEYLLSKPKTWKFTKEGILKERNSECYTTTEYEINKILDGLKTFGFVKIKPLGKSTENKFVWEFKVSITPFDERIFSKEEKEKLLPNLEKELNRRKSLSNQNTQK